MLKEAEPERGVEAGCCLDWLLVHECTHVTTCTKKEGKKEKQENT